MTTPLKRFVRIFSPALRVALLYLLIAGAWIVFSDRLLESLVQNPAELGRWQSIKGIGFVLVTAILLYVERAYAIQLSRRQEELLSQRVALFELAPNPLWVVDLDSLHFLAVNPAAEQFYGYTPNEFYAKKLPDMRAEEEKTTLNAMIEALTLNKLHRYTTRHMRKDGQIVDVTVTGRMTIWNGKPAAVFSITDITELLQTERTLRELTQQLEQRVAERTADLQRKNRELETFAYSISHDLKAPLRGIDGYSRLLLEDHVQSLNEEGREFLHAIRRGASQMAQLIDALLEYSRLERRNLVVSRVELQPLIDTLLNEFQSDIQARAVQVTVNLPFESVDHDFPSLYQALHNLLENALKFSNNQPHPHIEIGGEERQNSRILWVRDNGIGFDMQYHDRLFEIFQRLNHSEDYPGTGIGLVIVRKAMERIGGRVWAVSTPGKGATFFLEIPKNPSNL